MAENLAYIPHVSPPREQGGIWVFEYKGNNVSEAKATQNYSTYGCLYDWQTAKKVAPDGWHLPTDNEWKQLEDFLIKESGDERGIGKLLKSRTSWRGTDIDLYGFSALQGSNARLPTDTGGGCWEVMQNAQFWSSTDIERDYAWCRILDVELYGTDQLRRFDYSKKCGLSVRCMRN
jgi:uncharacterized protein (TIGR02145 family)